MAVYSHQPVSSQTLNASASVYPMFEGDWAVTIMPCGPKWCDFLYYTANFTLQRLNATNSVYSGP